MCNSSLMWWIFLVEYFPVIFCLNEVYALVNSSKKKKKPHNYEITMFLCVYSFFNRLDVQKPVLLGIKFLVHNFTFLFLKKLLLLSCLQMWLHCCLVLCVVLKNLMLVQFLCSSKLFYHFAWRPRGFFLFIFKI